jgi:hypothetical protein
LTALSSDILLQDSLCASKGDLAEHTPKLGCLHGSLHNVKHLLRLGKEQRLVTLPLPVMQHLPKHKDDTLFTTAVANSQPRHLSNKA